MENYTKEDVLNALNTIDSKTRKRSFVDQRSYLIGILAFKFMMGEHAIAKVSNLKRHTINYNKKLVLQFYKDKFYVENVHVYSQMFPFDFSVIQPFSASTRTKRVELNLDTKIFNKIKTAGAILGHKNIRTTIKFFLEKSLMLWEK